MPNRLELTGTTAPAPPPTLPAGALRVRGRVAEAMLAAHALSPEDSFEFTLDPRDAAAFAKLREAGIIRAESGGRFWFDLVAYHVRDQAQVRVRAMWGFGIATTGAIAAVLLYRL